MTRCYLYRSLVRTSMHVQTQISTTLVLTVKPPTRFLPFSLLLSLPHQPWSSPFSHKVNGPIRTQTRDCPTRKRRDEGWKSEGREAKPIGEPEGPQIRYRESKWAIKVRQSLTAEVWRNGKLKIRIRETQWSRMHQICGPEQSAVAPPVTAKEGFLWVKIIPSACHLCCCLRNMWAS